MKHYTPEDVQELRAKVLRITGICNQCSPQQVADLINAAVDEAVEAAIVLLDAADCPQCVDKSGAYYANDGDVCQCQWCSEVADLKAIRARSDNGAASNGHSDSTDNGEAVSKE